MSEEVLWRKANKSQGIRECQHGSGGSLTFNKVFTDMEILEPSPEWSNEVMQVVQLEWSMLITIGKM